ncbi:TRAP transporter substrate-binding protein DctP [Microbacteriaceae bacterium K1510]|nr:TRAP transporter substrate-binding protein DctP [Microbacteriaceae bacterium K1510]
MRFKKILTALALSIVTAGAADASELRVLASWDDTAPSRNILLQTYLKNVEAAAKGDITFKVSGPETVPAFEQLQPVSSGVFQMLFTHGAYHVGATPMLIPIDGLKGTGQALRASGIFDVIDKQYKRFGLKLVFMAKSPEGTGYQMILRAPVGPSGDLTGRKIRGTQTYAGALAMLGASPVVLPPSEIYSALDKGIVDGAAWPAVGVREFRWTEVAKYLMRPTFGASPYFLFVNLNAWNKLTDAQRAVLTEEGKKIEAFWDTESVKLTKDEESALISQGAQITQLAPEPAAKISAAFEKGLWDLAAKTDPKAIDELHEFTKKHGFSN